MKKNEMLEPELSLVMPCFNEEVAIGTTAPDIVRVFQREGVILQLVLVENGSSDQTGKVIDKLIELGYPITKVCHQENQGYGGGIISGLEACKAPIIGFLCADGQVESEDALMAYRLIKGRENRTITKVRRRFRKDSWRRKMVSIFYNGLMQVLFGWLGAIDLNGSPKIFSKKNFRKMKIVSRDWFLDPEIIIKAKYLGLRIIEVDVEGHSRKGGASNVRLTTCFEFLNNIIGYRFGRGLKDWKKDIKNGEKETPAEFITPSPSINVQTNKNINKFKRDGSFRKKSSLNDIIVLEQKRFEDDRGFVHKVLTNSQCKGNPPKGEVYVTSALPGQSKGNHFHSNMGEWFSIIKGEGQINVCDPDSGEKFSVSLGEVKPKTVYIPPGLAHSILNTGKDLMICVAWAEREHDPLDVFPFKL